MYTGSIPYGSQWSLTFEVRKRVWQRLGHHAAEHHVAMEPDL